MWRRLSLPCDAREPLIVLCFGRVRAGRMRDGRGAGCTDGADILNGRDTGGFHSTWHAVVFRHKVAADPVKCQHDTPNSFVHCSSAVEISSTGCLQSLSVSCASIWIFNAAETGDSYAAFGTLGLGQRCADLEGRQAAGSGGHEDCSSFSRTPQDMPPRSRLHR